MDKAKLAAKAMQLAQQMLKEMLVTQDVAKIRAYLASQGASWIGQNKNAFVPDSNAFAKGYQHKYPRPLPESVLKQVQWRQLYIDEQLCIIYCQLDVPAADDSDDPDCSRFTFTLAADGEDVHVLNLHSSRSWKFMQDEEVYPHQYATLFFKQLEAQQEASSLPAFVAANSPNGMKLCKIEQRFPAVYVNKTLCSMAGYGSMTEMLQATHGQLDKMVYSQDIAKVTQAMLSHQNGTPYSINYRLLHKRGTIVWVLERGQYIVDELTGNEFYICAIVPLALEQHDFSYGTLVDSEAISKHKIPIELFMKMALEIISSNHPKTSIDKLLPLACDILQADGMVIYDLHSRADKLLVVNQCIASDHKPIAAIQDFTRAEILELFDGSGCSKCSDTSYLPVRYKHATEATGITAMLSYLIYIKSEPAYIVSAYHLGKQYSWSENEQEILQQLAKIFSFLFRNC